MQIQPYTTLELEEITFDTLTPLQINFIEQLKPYSKAFTGLNSPDQASYLEITYFHNKTYVFPHNRNVSFTPYKHDHYINIDLVLKFYLEFMK